ncbi:hypothetical protein [Dactylosporangium sp. CA-092794]|uniref:hypothetical protein n=1 Tax=Dactylosporangium sp. CA-092794 TaxID=3239929 RepID=UPI003D8A1F98
MRLRFVVLVGFAGLLLVACASPDSSEPVSAPPPSIATPPGSGGPSLPASGGPSLRPGDSSVVEVSVTGTVQDGVEPGCVLLATDSKTYLLVGPKRAELPKAGTRATVYGHPEPDLLSTCQQGTPFRVNRVEP